MPFTRKKRLFEKKYEPIRRAVAPSPPPFECATDDDDDDGDDDNDDVDDDDCLMCGIL